MNPVENPFTPGAGSPPPELAGRDDLRSAARIALKRIQQGRFSKSLILVGLRGVGKTVLLERIRQDAESLGLQGLRIEARENQSLPAMLMPQLRVMLLRLSKVAQAKDLATRALRGLASFVNGLKVKYEDIEVGLDFEPEPGLADNGNLELDLQDLFSVVGEAAARAKSAAVICIDELQYVPEDQLATLIAALHFASQRNLPITLIGAGLPNLRGQFGNAKSYAERLFEFPSIGALSPEAARQAISKPIEAEGIKITEMALEAIVTRTQGYAYFLQEWGKHTWDIATSSPIDLRDVEAASIETIATLDESFFRVRFDRLTPLEKKYLRAMAELGDGIHRSGDIAAQLQRAVTALAPTRNNLIAKGMIWSPSHGDTQFTVPLFDQFMKRIMPGQDWRT
jgi:AAA ATPase domain